MPPFPKIASPCPYVSNLAAIMDGDQCRMCKRQVFDLTAMSEGERLAFLAGCEEEVCVSYSIPVRPALRAAAIAAALAAPAAAAGGQAQRQVPPPPIMIPVAGGLPVPSNVQVVELPPVVESTGELAPLYEDGRAPAAGKPKPKPPVR